MSLEIPPNGREYVHWTVTGAPDGAALSVSFDEGATWHSLTVSGDQATALVAGPDAAANPAGTVVLAAGRSQPRIRLEDNPEVVIRGGGVIDVREPR